MTATEVIERNRRETAAGRRSPSPFEQMRWDEIDAAVRAVMRLGSIPQGYMGTIKVNRTAVISWWDQGAPLNAWWWAFSSAVQAEYRRGQRLAS